jgi:dienelactone hydrolase
MNEWSIRTILNPVITRLLIYGINPIDLEYVLAALESTKMLNSKQLEKEWLSQWNKKANHFITIADNAVLQGNFLTAKEMYFFAAQCYYACFLINFSNVNQKIEVYEQFAEYYLKSVTYEQNKIEKINIPLNKTTSLFAYIHYPVNPENIQGVVAIFSGIGSCKEEMHHLAKSFTARGLIAIVPDMPGNGETVIKNDIKGRMKNIEGTFDAIVSFVKESTLKQYKLGTCGLCMGGGYSFRAAALKKEFEFCMNLFPLFINQVEEGATPQWMKSGAWVEKQIGIVDIDSYLQEMGLKDTDTLECPYFVAYGKYDNWMVEKSTLKLIERVKNTEIKVVTIDESPVFSGQSLVTHTMPVGEQLHWLRHVMADWALQIVRNGSSR